MAVAGIWAAVSSGIPSTVHALLTMAWALAAFAGVAVIDLRLIGRLFPGIRALPFWPQFADPLAWAGVFGAILQRRDQADKRTGAV